MRHSQKGRAECTPARPLTRWLHAYSLPWQVSPFLGMVPEIR